MPYYGDLTAMRATDRTRTREGLKRLRKQIRAELPEKNLEQTVIIATWNIREFDSPMYGERGAESLLYLAEIISSFDLVAVQEVRQDLRALRHLMRLLGFRWRYVLTDVTEGAAGNGERMAFLYDTRKIRFGGLAGELVLPPLADGSLVAQVARTPFMAGFEAGWTSFELATVHIRYGTARPDDPQRIVEIAQVAEFLRRRAVDRFAWSKNLVLLGDFNIFARTDATMLALEAAGWMVPEELQSIPGSNVAKDRKYDQIAIRPQRFRFDRTGRAGVLDPYESVYRTEDEPTYAKIIGPAYGTKKDGTPRTAAQSRTYYRAWRTFQLSDHLPMWLEVRIDYADAFLAESRADPGERTDPQDGPG